MILENHRYFKGDLCHTFARHFYRPIEFICPYLYTTFHHIETTRPTHQRAASHLAAPTEARAVV